MSSLVELSRGSLWMRDAPMRFLGMEIGARMTVVRLTGDRLFIHSPVGLDDNVAEELRALGRVAFIVSPNWSHHLYLEEWVDAYPRARVFAPPGLQRKRPDMRFLGVLGDRPRRGWAADLDQALLRGSRALREVVFFHGASHTLIVGDLLGNYDADSPSMTHWVMRAAGLYGKPMPPFDFRWSVSDREACCAFITRVLQWDFDRIVLSHGKVVENEGRDVVRRAFLWLYQ